MHKFDPRKRDFLDDPKRLFFENPDLILSEASVRPGQVVADIGCGTGFFTVPLAKYVGETGKVFALDTSPTMMKDLRKRTKHLKQVKPIHSKENRFPLEKGSIDFVLLVNMVHELDNWKLFFKEVRRVLKRGGKVCVVDFKKKKMDMGPPLKVRFTQARLREILRLSGYRRTQLLSPLPFHNGFIAVKK
jgi:ubiquinone/menaquinone biosynthesis C-methylase UbiE